MMTTTAGRMKQMSATDRAVKRNVVTERLGSLCRVNMERMFPTMPRAQVIPINTKEMDTWKFKH